MYRVYVDCNGFEVEHTVKIDPKNGIFKSIDQYVEKLFADCKDYRGCAIVKESK